MIINIENWNENIQYFKLFVMIIIFNLFIPVKQYLYNKIEIKADVR